MTETTSTDSNQPPQLVSIELRVLAALMEKQLTTPDQYPLTLNSLLSACNQKSSRDPVSNHTQGEVARTLTELQHRRLVSKEFGSRSEKFSQSLIKQLELGRKHQALLCVMMLRGPQTVSELHTRTQRMVEFAGKEDLEHILDRLCNRETPFATRLTQQPGQRGERFTHLFSGIPADAQSNRNLTQDVQQEHQEERTERDNLHNVSPFSSANPNIDRHNSNSNSNNTTTSEDIPVRTSSDSKTGTGNIATNEVTTATIDELTRRVSALESETELLKLQVEELMELNAPEK